MAQVAAPLPVPQPACAPQSEGRPAPACSGQERPWRRRLRIIAGAAGPMRASTPPLPTRRAGRPAGFATYYPSAARHAARAAPPDSQHLPPPLRLRASSSRIIRRPKAGLPLLAHPSQMVCQPGGGLCRPVHQDQLTWRHVGQHGAHAASVCNKSGREEGPRLWVRGLTWATHVLRRCAGPVPIAADTRCSAAAPHLLACLVLKQLPTSHSWCELEQRGPQPHRGMHACLLAKNTGLSLLLRSHLSGRQSQSAGRARALSP